MQKIKRIISFLLIFTIIISTFIYSVQLTVLSVPVTTMHITGTDVGVREGAGTECKLIERISQRTVTVVNTTPTWDSKKEYQWYKVTYHNGEKQITGWVAYDQEWIGGIYTYDPDASDPDFETSLKAFPSSYHEALKKLHAQYPNWKFIPDPVSVSFSEIVSAESVDMYKQVQYNSSSHPVSWRSMGPGAYTWSSNTWVTTNSGWTGASREVVAYYMDPRNFLDANSIYMFLEQSYNASVQNEEGVKKIIKGTFMEKNYTPAKDEPGDGSYSKVIMAAAKESGVSPYIIASKIRQEQSGTSPLISGTYNGYEGYYNYFNIGAYSTDDASVTVNGLKTAKSQGWNTRYKSIAGGAKYLAKNYIARGQDTYYYQDFNVHDYVKNSEVTHQYAQAVHDAYSKGYSLRNTYKDDSSFSLSFRIPIYVDMPSSAAAMPAKNSKKNNYYFDTVSVSGLTPSFSKFKYEYSLKVTGDTAVKVVPVSGATNTTKSQFALKKGVNTVTLTVKSETGYTTEYVISVNATKACTLYVNSTGKLPSGAGSSSSGSTSSGSSSSSSSTSSNNTSSSKPSSGSSSSSSSSTPNVARGDVNGDGKITISDLAGVQMHLLKVKVLNGNKLVAADINKDGKISISDLAGVQMHLLGIKLIKQ